MSEAVRAEGWHNWNLPEREKTSRYAEYNSKGPGASSSARVKWARHLTAREAQSITVREVLSGADGWDPVKRR
jgi:pectinesterase